MDTAGFKIVGELRGLAAKKDLAIGDAWNALDRAADTLEDAANWLIPVVERMRLIADTNFQRRPEWAETLRAFAKDVEASYLEPVSPLWKFPPV